MTSFAFLSSVNNFVVLLLFVQFFSAPTCIVCSVIVLMTISHGLFIKAICYSPLVAKNAGFENQNNSG